MKNKNMVLMAVAVGFGLVAAFVTTQLGAKPAAPETVKILVAKKELPVGTVLSESKINELVGIAEFPKNTVPPEALVDATKILDKKLTRTLRIGDKFMPSDIGQGKEIQLPKGSVMYTLKMDPVKAAAGFALPGSKVDLILTESVKQKNETIIQSNVLLRDMLVVAVDIMDVRPEGSKNAVQTLNSVSLAVLPKEGQMIALAAKRGDISLMLRDPESHDDDPLPPLDRLPFDRVKEEVVAPVAIAPRTVRIPVAKAEIAANTKVTSDNFDELFTDREFLDPAPANAARSRDELLGKVILKSIDADQFVPVGNLADKGPEVAKAAPKVERHTLTIQNGRQTTRHDFERENGQFRMVSNSDDTPQSAPRPRRNDNEPVQPRIQQLPFTPQPEPMIEPAPIDDLN